MVKGRLLILEDDRGVAKIFNLIARSTGFLCRVTADHRKFLRWADEWNPTHIALDWMIPGADGERVLVEMARRKYSARIVIISGMGERVLDTAMRTGIGHGLNIVGVLAKPFSIAALRDLLHDCTSMPLGRKEDPITAEPLRSRTPLRVS